MNKNDARTITQKILPKGFEYKSDDAFAQDFWVTQIEDAFDKNPNAEIYFRGATLRQLINHQRAVANIIEGQARKIDDLIAVTKKLAGLSVWEFILYKYLVWRHKNLDITKK